MIRRSEYHDSVTLMEIASEVNALPGVEDAAVVMATEANLALLQRAGASNIGFLTDPADLKLLESG